MRNRKTNPKLIKRLDKGVDKFGKRLLFDYISWGTAARWLDENYPGWSIQVTNFQEHAGSVNCVVSLTVFEIEGIKRIIEASGSKKIEVDRNTDKPVKLDYWKSAETDGFKRCVARLGGFNDIYTDNSDELTEDSIDYVFNILFPVLVNKATDSKDDYELADIAKTLKAYFKGSVSMDKINKKYMGVE